MRTAFMLAEISLGLLALFLIPIFWSKIGFLGFVFSILVAWFCFHLAYLIYAND